MRRIRSLSKSILAKSGFRIVRANHHTDLVPALKVLSKKYGRRIETVLDIGANSGEWSQALMKQVPGTKAFLVEASPSHEEALRNSGLPFRIAAVARDFGSRDFFSISGTGDSFYREKTHHYDSIEPIQVSTVPLDWLMSEALWPQPDFVKIDTQGSELEVIEGGKQTIRGASFLLIEHSLIEWNEGSPSLSDVLNALQRLSFKPWGIMENHYADDALIQIDILWVNHNLSR